ncbi:MAG TPA: nuclear transport factor 2 family protein [Gemmatimonadaceae bacterium]|jgi:ketosteroid isomerase-like protein|nr:nuclear transport factor 2 family protein [Gemmatimonadaceae bacterium]
MPIKQQVQHLVELVEQGRMLEAIEAYYGENVAMQENLDPPTVGLAANLQREREFFDSLLSVKFRAVSVIVEGERAAINWVFDYTTADGQRYRMDQIAVQTWRDGKIVHERYIYDTATLALAA